VASRGGTRSAGSPAVSLADRPAGSVARSLSGVRSVRLPRCPTAGLLWPRAGRPRTRLGYRERTTVRFDAHGRLTSTWPVARPHRGVASRPSGLATGPDGELWAADVANDRVLRVAGPIPNRAPLVKSGCARSEPKQTYVGRRLSRGGNDRSRDNRDLIGLSADERPGYLRCDARQRWRSPSRGSVPALRAFRASGRFHTMRLRPALACARATTAARRRLVRIRTTLKLTSAVSVRSPVASSKRGNQRERVDTETETEVEHLAG